MKKTLLLCLSTLLITSLSFAQMSIGVRGALSGSTVTKFDLIENITPDFNLTPSATGAFFLEVPLSPNFSFQPEFVFQQKGFNVSEGLSAAGTFLNINLPINSDLDFRTSYLEIPLLAKFHLGDKTQSHAYFMAGPSLGLLVDATARVDVFSVIPLRTNVNRDFFKPLDFSVVAAAGFEVPFSEKLNGFAELRYQHGITRIIDSNFLRFDVRNRTLSGGLGLKYAI